MDPTLGELPPERKPSRIKGISAKCGLSYQRANVMGCLPLAPCVILLGLGFLTHCIYVITATFLDGEDLWTLGFFIDMVFCIFEFFAAVASFYAVAFRSCGAINLFIVGYNVSLVNLIVEFITDWLEWLMVMNGNVGLHQMWEPSRDDIIYITMYTLIIVSIVMLSFIVVYGVLNSCKAVFASGGHGWEGKSYVQLINIAEEQAVARARKRISMDPNAFAEIAQSTGLFFYSITPDETYSKKSSKPASPMNTFSWAPNDTSDMTRTQINRSRQSEMGIPSNQFAPSSSSPSTPFTPWKHRNGPTLTTSSTPPLPGTGYHITPFSLDNPNN